MSLYVEFNSGHWIYKVQIGYRTLMLLIKYLIFTINFEMPLAVSIKSCLVKSYFQDSFGNGSFDY